MINHNLFFEKWLDLASTEAQEDAMKNYMLGLAPDELTRFILWKTDEASFRDAQKQGAFSAETKDAVLIASDKRIALKRGQNEQIAA